MQIIYKEVLVNYTVNGQGPCMLLLHGWGGNTKSLSCFEQSFVKTHKIINLDFPPFGESGELKSDFTIFDYVEIVKQILLKERENSAVVIAHSFGGRVALILAKEKFVKKLILISSAGIRINKLNLYLKVKIFKFKKKISKIFKTKKFNEKKFGSSDYVATNGHLRQTFINIVNFDERYLLKHITCSTLLIWGNRDEQTPIKIAKILRRKIADCGLVVLSGGHFVYCERFVEVNAIIKDFIG